MKKYRRINIKRLIKNIEKKYGGSELVGFVLSYAEKIDISDGKIIFPEFFDEIASGPAFELADTPEAIAEALGSDDFSYRKLECFYSYMTLSSLMLLEESAVSEELLSKTAEFLKRLYRIEPRQIYPYLSEAERQLNMSPFFEGCDEATQNACRKKVIEKAKKLSLKESEIAKLFRTRDPFEHGKSIHSLLYFPVLLTVTVLLSIFAFLTVNNFSVFLFLILPLSEGSKQICDLIFSYTVPVQPIPKKKLKSIPNDAKTLTVLTCLLSGKESDRELCEKLKNCYFANKDENALFGLLCDFREAESTVVYADKQNEQRVKDELERINKEYGCNLYFFIRDRKYAPTEKKYMGWERKRGALIELIRMLKGEMTSIRVAVGDEGKLSNIRYTVTLDCDTRLYPSALKDLLGAMLHPSNKPVIRGGIVKKGYGVLQPKMEASLTSAEKTPFALLCAGNGGSDIYATATYETYQSIFGEGIYCGKGIFDNDVFYTLLDKAFPDGCVLSHDLLEGSYLRAGALSDISLTDDLPKSPLSCFERSNRWLRGDVQALAFAGKYVKNADGVLVKNPISPLSRFKIYDNVRRGLVPVSALVSILLCIFSPSDISVPASVFALSYLILPFLFSFVSLVKSSGKRFFSFLLPEFINAAENLLYSLASLFHTAQNNIDALFRSGYRMLFSRQKLLSWKTASDSDSLKGASLYLYRMLPSLSVGVVLLLLCPKVPLKILGILFAVFPFISYGIGKERKKKIKISESKKKRLYSYGKDIWKFFEDNVTKADNYLPPDNIIISPGEKTAHRTSPTNIGLYLLSCFSAYKMGYITLNDALHRINCTVNTVKLLPKWQGHLYNWYDTKTLMILGSPYVSTVDSGNFITAAVALKEALKDTDLPEYFSHLPKTLEELIGDADFFKLYDEKSKLFIIGLNTESGKRDGHYDFYASEARTTSFYAVATSQAPMEHWRSLKRTLCVSDGYLGLVSWTGTAFEYLMPTLLLPVIQMSLSYEALYFAVREQKRAAVKGVWGMSESGYYHFDSELNYQYKAFGVPSLGLKRGLEKELVISPYSTFLALPFGVEAALWNLKRLKDKGMYGIYGFYESIDFTPKRVGRGNAVIRSYMSHHMGMSLIACANMCCDNYFQKMFMSDPYCSSAIELLEEKVPINARIHKLKKPKVSSEKNHHAPRFVFGEGSKSKAAGGSCLISENGISVAAQGQLVQFNANKEQISLDPFVFGDIYRPRLLFSANGAVFDALSGKMNGGIDKSSITYALSKSRLESTATFSILGKYSAIAVSLSVKGSFTRLCPMLSFIPCPCSVSEKTSHPAYADIMTVCEYHEKEKALVFTKRHKSKGESCICVSLESGGGFDFALRRDILPSHYTEKDIEGLLDLHFDNKDGTLINPFCAVKKASDAKERYQCNFLIIAGKGTSDVMEKLRHTRVLLRAKKGSYADKAAKYYSRMQRERMSVINCGVYFSAIADAVLNSYKSGSNSCPSELHGINEFWAYGISADNPILCLILEDKSEGSPVLKELLKTFISVHKFFALCGIKIDTVILYNDNGEYFSTKRQVILDAAEETGAGFFMKNNGGIFLIPNTDCLDLFENVAFMSVILSTSFTLEKLNTGKKDMVKSGTVPIKRVFGQSNIADTGLKTYSGAFTDRGFTINKTKKPFASPPYSYVYAKNHFGTLVTDHSLGYTWIGNSHERRITRYYPDNLLDLDGEKLIGRIDDCEYDLISCSHTASFTRGGAVYEGNIEGFAYTVKVMCDPYLPCKTVVLEANREIDAEYRIIPVLGDCQRINRPIRITEEESENGRLTHFVPTVISENGADEAFLLKKCFENTVCFILGAHPLGNYSVREYIIAKYKTSEAFLNCAFEYEKALEKMLPRIKSELPNRYLSEMTDYYLPYQALVCRFFGRTGFYQSGGAYGFRDQLQDCLCIMLSAPDIARTHILRCACKQYEEGDVMHWWHIVRGEGRGVRTHYSDDLLWLPYIAVKYAVFTGDYEIFNIKVPYITSSPLSENEKDRYEKAVKSEYKESLYHHCVRAIEHSLLLGERGLPKMKGGDWNDGMNEVKGESVWLGFFLSKLLHDFAPISIMQGDISGASKYNSLSRELLQKCENCFSDGRYLRAFFEDGGDISDSSFIDLMPQSFSVFAQAERANSRTALKESFLRLFDRENSAFALLDPPFDRPSEKNVGYISSYPKGVRENGGQYTHAAVWCAMAMLESGLKNEGAYVLESINPAFICSDKKGEERYRGEPYFVAGDVSTAPEIKGRCGWSLYTGASGWYFNAVFSGLLGIVIEGDRFSVSPNLSKVFPSYTLKLAYLSTIYEIKAEISDKAYCILDGKNVNNLFYFDKKSHYLEIGVEISEYLQ